jgi:hypothetical protein
VPAARWCSSERAAPGPSGQLQVRVGGAVNQDPREHRVLLLLLVLHRQRVGLHPLQRRRLAEHWRLA